MSSGDTAPTLWPNLMRGTVRWMGRVIWDHVNGDETGKKYTIPESIDSHRPEWCAALGIPVTPL